MAEKHETRPIMSKKNDINRVGTFLSSVMSHWRKLKQEKCNQINGGKK